MSPVDDFIHSFSYKPDGPFGGWKITWIGDCEDFALTLAYIMAGRSKRRLIWNILTFRVVFWFTLSVGRDRPHWVLWVRGHGWIDNIVRVFREEPLHRRLFPLPVLPAVFALTARSHA